jgi:hypothetical protein
MRCYEKVSDNDEAGRGRTYHEALVIQQRQQDVVGVIDALPDAPKERNLTALGTLARRNDAADFRRLATEDSEVDVLVVPVVLGRGKDRILGDEEPIHQPDGVERDLQHRQPPYNRRGGATLTSRQECFTRVQCSHAT